MQCVFGVSIHGRAEEEIAAAQIVGSIVDEANKTRKIESLDLNAQHVPRFSVASSYVV